MTESAVVHPPRRPRIKPAPGTGKRPKIRNYRELREFLLATIETFVHPDEPQTERGALAFFRWAMYRYPREFLRLIGQLYPRDLKVSGAIINRIGVSMQSDADLMRRAAELVEQARRRAIETTGRRIELPSVPEEPLYPSQTPEPEQHPCDTVTQ